MMSENKKMKLYHGSKNGIFGDIVPQSRRHCDFGKGFYMGTDKMQPLTLICNFPKARLYTVQADLDGLKLCQLETDIDWALFVAYHRGKLEPVKGTSLYAKYRDLTKECDMVIGDIANDRMFVVLDRFFSGDITDTALIRSLAALKLGKQYVAVTEKACKQIKILEERLISDEEKKELLMASEHNRNEGISKAEDICKRYRREGRYFDEIISGGY